MKITKKKLTAFIAVVTVLTMMIGVMAYFTDRVDASANAKTAAADDIIKVTPDPEDKPEGGDEKTILEAEWNENNPDKIVEPGDEVNLSFDLKNIGDSKIDVKQTIILSSSIDMNADIPEWRLFSTLCEVGDADYDEYGAKVGKDVVVTEERLNARQIKYTITGFVLDNVDDPATVDVDETVMSQVYHLVFNKYAGNAFQGQTCTVDYLCEMRQHVDVPTPIDPNAGWEDIRTAEITFAGQAEYKVVPAA